MPAHDFLHRLLQRVAIKHALQLQRERDVIEGIGRLKLIEEPQALLPERQRQRRLVVALHAHHSPGNGRSVQHSLDARGEGRHRGRFEQRAQRHFDQMILAHTRHHHRGDQRMTTERKEIILPADALNAQDLLPQLADVTLHRRLRCDEGDLHGRQRQIQQGLTIHLAVRRERQLRQQHKVRRHHVDRQAGVQVRKQARKQRLLVALHRPAFHICHQPLLAIDVLGQHHRIAQVRMTAQSRLDLAQLDTVAAQLDLMINTPQECQVAIRLPSHQITRSI